MSNINSENIFILMFAPDQWSTIEKFRKFLGSPFPARGYVETGVSAIENHQQKYEIIAGIANRLRPRLAEDIQQLEQIGYSPNKWAKEYAALIETLFCELYCCLDGLRRVIYGAYRNRNVKGVQHRSTETLFKNAYEHKYGPEFPSEIESILSQAYYAWFLRLHEIRTEVTHGDIGHCTYHIVEDRVSYTHQRLKTTEGVFTIEDISRELNSMHQSVNLLIDRIFEYFYGQLEMKERRIPCGVYKGLFYERIVAPLPNLSQHSGRCYSKQWFDKPGQVKYPACNRCNAYTR